MYAALAVALIDFTSHSARLILTAWLILFYAIGDHLDGMQAKRTQTSSALGEFFDHFLDAFNNGILLFTVLTLFEVTNSTLIAFFLFASYLAHASMFYEQFKTGWLLFDKIGSLEAVLFACILLLAAGLLPVYDFLTTAVFLNLTVIEMLFSGISLGILFSFIKTLLRAHITEPRFYMFCVLLSVTAILSVLIYSDVLVFLVITLYAGYYIGNLMRGHLADGIGRFPDVFIPMVLGIGLILNITGNPVFTYLVFLYFFVVIARLAYATIFALRKFWVWKNPVTENADLQIYTS